MVQYSLDFQGNFGRAIKDYGDIKLENIYSSYFLGDVIVFGGQHGKIDFLDIKKRKFLKIKFKVAPKNIYSMELSLIKQNQSESKVFLTMSGEDYDYSSKTDVFDITDFISNQIKLKLERKIKTLFENNFKESNKTLN